MSKDTNNLLSPKSHTTRLRLRKDLLHNFDSESEVEGECEIETERDQLLSSNTLNRESFATEPQEVVNMGLHQLRTARGRGTATKKMKTVKKAWGTFKAKLRPTAQQQPPRISRQQLWSITLSSPQSPGARRLMLNSPLTPDPYPTPDNHRKYRPISVATPLTPATPTQPAPTEGLRRSARIASRTPTLLRNTQRQGRRATPKRIQLTSSPGEVLCELNAMTIRSSRRSVSSGVKALETISTGFTETIHRQDSSGNVATIPIQKPIKPSVEATSKAQVAAESKENEPQSKENDLEPKRRLRLRHSRAVLVPFKASDGQMLTEDFF